MARAPEVDAGALHGPAQLAPTLTGHLFAPLGRELVELLRGLTPAAWGSPTVCRAWQVRDIAAHLLDTALRRLSFVRDRQPPPAPASPIAGYRELVVHLDALNAEWARAARRLSPRLLTELLEWVEPRLAEHLAAVDPDGPAAFAVAWAGEEESASWFDVARELTERWIHQQQIRLAVAAPALVEPELSRAVFDTLLRALPRSYAALQAPDGVTVALTVRGERDYRYTLERAATGWHLLRGSATGATASVALDEQTAWLLLSKGMPGAEARARAAIDGEARLLEPFFATLSVMA
jgi:uncharacterized protein (TIGR03083 family)